MADYDAKVRVGTDVDTSQMQKLEIQINKATQKVASLADELDKVRNKKVPTEEYQEIAKQISEAEKKLEGLNKRQERMIGLGKDSGSAWDGLQYDIADAKNTIKYAKEELEELVKTGKAFTLGGDAEEIATATNRLSMAEAELRALNTRKAEVLAVGLARAEKSGRKLFGTLQNGARKTNGLLSTLSSRLKGIALSLLVFNWITKGFNAMVSAMKEGFRNLAQYSSEYNKSMSALKSQTAQLKNGLAAAFEPIANMILPYLTQLVSWLNTAADAIAQFLAVLQGKSTYTRAKKQVIDYADSLDTAAKSAKGALASFDQLNVLNKENGGVSGGGLSGAEAFEEATVNPEMYTILEKVKGLLEIIKPLVIGIGIALLAWKIAEFLTSLGKVSANLKTAYGVILFIAGAALAVYEYLNMWNNGVDWNSIIGYISGVAMAALGLYLVCGSLASGIVLIVGSVAGLVLAFKDMMTNGINAENMFLAVVSAVGLVLGVFLVFGGTAAIVVGAIMGVIAVISTMVAWAGNGEEALARLKNIFSKLGSFIKNVFAGDFEAALEDIKGAATESFNMIQVLVESFINVLIKGINWFIGKINEISFDIPDWVPVIGGGSWSPNIKTFQEVSLPRLADGAVIQGGQPFAAILGDQRFGQTNIETPLATMVEAFKQAQAENGGAGGGTYTFVAQLNGRTIFQEMIRQNQMQYKAKGKSTFA